MHDLAQEITYLRARLAHLALQQPLLETRPSLEAVSGGCAAPPRAVFVGVGLVSDGGLSRALPLDVLGLLLGAEDVRRTLGVDALWVLLADEHAVRQGAPETAVRPCADHYEQLLERVGASCGLDHMRLIRASELHRTPAYQRTLARVARRAPDDADAYVVREVADIAHFLEESGGLVKVGWALQPTRRGAERDERMFDECFQRWVDDEAWFLYAKAGRALDDRRRKAPPYAESNASRRICLLGDENVAEKLARARGRVCDSTWRGVRNHLSAITRAYSRLVRPLEGPLETRVQTMVQDVLGDRPPATQVFEPARPAG